ncbi:lisH domain-containing protein ARMC9-like [Dysidea avara]|uniref:lisH domain-containing protein ARMC9-like n=1 Tax=Dysidea avara TaxID=196820 RepID=UPI0033236B36
MFCNMEVLQKKLAESELKRAEAIKQLKSLSIQYNQLKGQHYNLTQVGIELITTLEKTIRGESITPEYILDVSQRLYSIPVQDSGIVVDANSSTSISEEPSNYSTQSLTLTGSVLNNFIDAKLAINLIKKDLLQKNFPSRKKALIIQAMRWRLTQPPLHRRHASLQCYITNDLLGCNSAASVLQFLNSSYPFLEVKEQLARLINSVASLREGRCYLCQHPELLRLLNSEQTFKEEDDTMRNILGALQKLSLRYSVQSRMISIGLLPWTIKVLQHHDTLSDYTLHYSLALLMNLVLRTAGKEACIPCASDTLMVLSDLLEHEDQEVRSYVNGILYSLVQVPAIREQAKAMGMREMLDSALKASPPELQGQLNYIIAQLGSTDDQWPGEYASDDEGVEEEENEEEEAELLEGDEEDKLVTYAGDKCGEDLLAEYYVPIASASMTELKASNNPMQLRPVTPHSFAGKTVGDGQTISPPRANSHLDTSLAYYPRPSTQPKTSSSRNGGITLPQIESTSERPRTSSSQSRKAARDNTANDTTSHKTSKPSSSSSRTAKQSSSSTTSSTRFQEKDIAFSSKPLIPRTPNSRLT